MPLREAARELELLVRSRHSILYLSTADEDRVQTLLYHLADHMRLPLFTWSRARGLGRVGAAGTIYQTEEPVRAFAHVEASDVVALYHFQGLGPHFEGHKLLPSHITEASKQLEQLGGAIILTGLDIPIPPELEPRVTRPRMPQPSREEYRTLLRDLIRDVSQRQHVEVHLSQAETDRLLNHLTGLTAMEVRKILTKAIIEDGMLDSNDIQHVIEAKRAVVERDGLLEYTPVEETMADIADLANLKAWLAKRTMLIQDPARAREFGLSFPKGMLLLGIPGCGKSLSAKAVASEWRLPLLKLDTSNLYNKYIGQSEQNFKRAMATAEDMAPVVLWIDELEKAFSVGGSEDGGVSQRILGSFLSWMQDREGDVFVVATANDIARLPPEFLRKGRFDEIFFVDLPDQDTRAQIFQIHLRSRGNDPSDFDLELLAEQTDGFSGSEIEQVVLSGLYTAFSDEATLTTALLSAEIRGTHPLSVTMAEKIAGMRDWAVDRAIRAN